MLALRRLCRLEAQHPPPTNSEIWGGWAWNLPSLAMILRSVSLFHGICDAQDLGITASFRDSKLP